ncbi:protein phosphatase 2C domain-containing protein [Candidatus Marinimicrobia bacterium]|nr:protein phosphatase 2C domain-containing protein [Candidatus Neomarinimicrobiota bacterium]
MNYSYKANYNTVKGPLHIKNGLPCQDKTYYLRNKGLNIMVLADGAGSAKFSDKGAKEAVKTTANFLNENFEEIYKARNNKKHKVYLVESLYKKILSIKLKNHSIKDYASTLLFVATYKDKYLVGHLGDGAIAIKRQKKVSLLSKPENGETENETFFYTSKNASDKLRIKKGKIKKNLSFALMSDGAYDCVFDKKSKKFTNALYRFLDWTKSENENDVTKAIQKNIVKHFYEKTLDDISLAILDISID